MSQARACYSSYVREKDFITKVHKHLPKSIYAWKINDPYHGGVPDAFYSGEYQHCFIEYKYLEVLPKRNNSLVKVKLSAQQRACLRLHAKNNINAYVVIASGDLVYITENFDLETITVKEFTTNAISFVQYIDNLVGFCLGGAEL